MHPKSLIWPLKVTKGQFEVAPDLKMNFGASTNYVLIFMLLSQNAQASLIWGLAALLC